jgi:hypothetical protein
VFDIPGMVGAPDPGCWAATFDSNVPVACQQTQPLSTDTRSMPTTSYNYPPWSLVLPGLASFLPSAGGYAYVARLLNAALPIAMVAWALWSWSRRGSGLSAAALLGLTPIAWFTFAVVSPSSVAIAGGLALWTGLLLGGRHTPIPKVDTLALAGWIAVMLPRRDGALWATLIALSCCWLLQSKPSDLVRRFGRSSHAAIAVTAGLVVLTPLRNGDHGFNLLLALSPAALLAVDLLARRAERLETSTERRALVSYSVGIVVLGAFGAAVARPGGFDAHTTRLVVAATARHLRQLVGVLGWLSTPVPLVAVFAFWVAVGAIAGIGLVEYRRATVIASTGLGVMIVTAWLLELGQGADYGEYWQGRYSMPLAIGLPIALAWRPSAEGSALIDQLSPLIRWASWGIANVAFVAAQQRWGSGVSGSWDPGDWNTWGAPIPPALLVTVHAGAVTALIIASTPSTKAPAAT